jgi:hypothetical protein
MDPFSQILMKPPNYVSWPMKGGPRPEEGGHLGVPRRCMWQCIATLNLGLEWVITDALVHLRQTAGLMFFYLSIRGDQNEQHRYVYVWPLEMPYGRKQQVQSIYKAYKEYRILRETSKQNIKKQLNLNVVGIVF